MEEKKRVILVSNHTVVDPRSLATRLVDCQFDTRGMLADEVCRQIVEYSKPGQSVCLGEKHFAKPLFPWHLPHDKLHEEYEAIVISASELSQDHIKWLERRN